MIKKFMGLMIGIPLLGAAAEGAGKLSDGLGKTMANTAVGLGSIGLAASMLPKKIKSKGEKMKW